MFIAITIIIPIILFTFFEGNWPKRLFKWLFKNTTIPMTQKEALKYPLTAIETTINGIPNIFWFIPFIVLIIVIIAIS